MGAYGLVVSGVCQSKFLSDAEAVHTLQKQSVWNWLRQCARQAYASVHKTGEGYPLSYVK